MKSNASQQLFLLISKGFIALSTVAIKGYKSFVKGVKSIGINMKEVHRLHENCVKSCIIEMWRQSSKMHKLYPTLRMDVMS